jgi:hypothetical protein
MLQSERRLLPPHRIAPPLASAIAVHPSPPQVTNLSAVTEHDVKVDPMHVKSLMAKMAPPAAVSAPPVILHPVNAQFENSPDAT